MTESDKAAVSRKSKTTPETERVKMKEKEERKSAEQVRLMPHLLLRYDKD